MAATGYYLPEITKYDEVYTLEELRDFFLRGELTQSDVATEEFSGLTYLVGDLIRSPELKSRALNVGPPVREEDIASGEFSEKEEWHRPIQKEFRGDIPVQSSLIPPSKPVEEVRPIHTEIGMGNFDTRPFVEDELEETQEYCLYDGHPSWWSYPRSMLFVTLGLLAVALCTVSGVGFECWLFIGAIAGIVATCISLHRITTTYVVTNIRVEVESGIIGSNSKEVRIRDIRAIDVTQKGWEPILGIGTIHFDSSATQGPEVSFTRVRKPHEIKHMIRQLQLQDTLL